MLVYQDLTSYATQTAGTFVVTGNVDVSAGLTIELNPSVFTNPGVWTLMSWGGTLTGSEADVSLVAGTGLTLNVPARPYREGNTFKAVLS
jgi:hypothetical protein